MAEKIAIVCALQDEASKNILNSLQKQGIPKWANVYKFDCDTLVLPLNECEEENIIVLSKHKSSVGTKSLTVHSLGNFENADFGGEEKSLCGSLAKIQTNLLRGLFQKNKNSEFNVCYEVTHHGPFALKNICFIELGSSINEWNRENEAEVIAKSIIEDALKQNEDKVVIGIGGGHYAPEFSKLALRKPYSFGHICPSYALEHLDSNLLEQMISKTNAEEIILDWKGLKGNKEKVVSLCEKSNIPFERVQRILK